MRTYSCDLCGKEIGVCFSDFPHTFSNELKISTWITVPRQREQIKCAYDLCDDCAKRIHRELDSIANNHAWRRKDHKRPFSWNGVSKNED